MRYADYYSQSAHPRRSAHRRSIGSDDLHLTRIRQQAHALDDPPTPELIVGVVLGGVTRCRWTWGDGWNLTDRRQAGDIGLTPPGSGGTFEVDGDHEILVIGLPLAALAQRGLIEPAAARPFGRLHEAYHRDAAGLRMCLRLWALAGVRDGAADMEADSIAAALVTRWRERAERPVAAPRPVRPLESAVVSRIRAGIVEAPGALHRLDGWARIAGMTPAAFCRAFRARVGLPPHRFLLEERMRLAETMLASPHSDIDAIVEALGFDSRSHFNRVFARLRGRAPRDLPGRLLPLARGPENALAPALPIR